LKYAAAVVAAVDIVGADKTIGAKMVLV